MIQKKAANTKGSLLFSIYLGSYACLLIPQDNQYDNSKHDTVISEHTKNLMTA